jgi:hypothetical protein
VIEVSRPPRKGARRLAGKNDLIDARHAASEVLAGRATATAKSVEGSIESIRLVKIARDTAVKAHTTAMITSALSSSPSAMSCAASSKHSATSS